MRCCVLESGRVRGAWYGVPRVVVGACCLFHVGRLIPHGVRVSCGAATGGFVWRGESCGVRVRRDVWGLAHLEDAGFVCEVLANDACDGLGVSAIGVLAAHVEEEHAG